MATKLHYGVNRQLTIGGGADDPVGDAPPAAGGTASSLAEAALANPLSYPPLASCLAPGDTVTLAVAPGVPCVGGVVDGAIAALTAAGVEPPRITVLASDAGDTQHLLTELDAWRAKGVAFVTHDPTDEQQLCYAGATHAEQPLLLNRLLVQADVALPVTCAHATTSGHAAGVFHGFFPEFSGVAARQQEPAAASSFDVSARTSTGEASRFATAADEAGWLLGVTLVLHVAPSAAGGVQRIAAGPADQVGDELGPLVQDAWRRQAPGQAAGQAELVIASLTGDAREQTWANVGKALAVAAPLLGPDGAVAICTELTDTLPERYAELLSLADADEAWPALEGDDSPDAALTGQLIEARQRGPVYLMSGLDPDWVEEVGLAPVANERELARLAERRPNRVVVEGAQHVAMDAAGQPSRL